MRRWASWTSAASGWCKVQALLGFNLGVELGQLGVVITLWPLLRTLARVSDGSVARRLVEAGSGAVAGLGLIWFVTRMFG